MVVVDRALTCQGREGRSEAPFRIDRSGKYAGYCGTHLDAQVPRLHDSRYVIVLPLQSQRPSVHQDQNYRFARVHKHFQELPLPARQGNVRP